MLVLSAQVGYILEHWRQSLNFELEIHLGLGQQVVIFGILCYKNAFLDNSVSYENISGRL